LYFLLARDAPTSVVFRRGPSDWVQLIRWDTRTDTFQPGQWYHGRIFERRSDLSPDGRLLVYFATHQRHPRPRGFSRAWTAVSKPPYLEPLALWPKHNSFGGGGLFADNATLLLNHNRSRRKPHPDHDPGDHLRVQLQYYYGQDSPLFDERLMRDGWEYTGEDTRSAGEPASGKALEVWHKASPNREHVLIRRVLGFFGLRGGITRAWVEDFSVRPKTSEREYPLPEAEWAEWDHAGRLVIARAGQLIAVDCASGLRESILADFNDARPEDLRVPNDAKCW
jgi:hypothetical protein